MKKINILLVMLAAIFMLTGCEFKESDALKFKNAYEDLNKQETAEGVKYRSISIDKDNPIVYTTFKEVKEKIDNKETFIVYVGFSACPWCRTVIPYILEAAKENKIDKIYYVNVREDNTKESDLRGYYKVNEEGKVVYDIYPDKYYHDILNSLNDLLEPYTITDENENVYETGENRLYAPTLIVYKKGKAKIAEDCISESQKDGYQKITKTMIKDMKAKATKVFKEYK